MTDFYVHTRPSATDVGVFYRKYWQVIGHPADQGMIRHLESERCHVATVIASQRYRGMIEAGCSDGS